MRISVAKDFSPHPGPRWKRQGGHSGELFRERLMKALAASEFVLVDLDGTSGFGSSFLDEAFGGLVFGEGMSKDEVRRRIQIKSDEDATYATEAWEAVELAEPQAVLA